MTGQRRGILLLLGAITILACSCSETGDVENGPDTIRFFAIGDFGRGGVAVQKAVADAMEQLAAKKKINFVLSLGDNFYPDGILSVDDPQLKGSFEDVYTGPALSDVPWYVALGNHDYHSNPAAEIAYTKMSTRWNMPDYFYTVTFPLNDSKLRLVVLDTNPFEKSYYPEFKFARDTIAEKQWIDSVFSINDADWTIVSGHHPLYTGGMRVNEPNSVRSSLLPIFSQYKIPVYFAGHEHDLQHLQREDLSFNQFISGAGSEIRPTGSMDYTKFSASANGFMSVEVTNDALSVYVISSAADTLYKTTIPR